MKEVIDFGSNYAQGSVILYRGEIYSYWDEGCTRYVFTNQDKTKVIKIPKENSLQEYNDREYEIYNQSREEDRDKMAMTT